MKRFILSLFLGLSITAFGSDYLDSLWRVWEDETKHDTVRLEALKTYGWEGYIYTYPDSANYYAKIQYNFAKEVGNRKYMASALNTQGAVLHFNGYVDEAIDIYLTSISIQKEIGNDKGVAAGYSNLGVIASGQGNNKLAADYYFKALKIFEKTDDKLRLAQIYNNLAILYNVQKFHNLAIDYYNKSLSLKLELGNPIEIGTGYMNLGAIYGDLGVMDTAIMYYNNAFSYFDEINHLPGMIQYYMNMGSIQFIQETDNFGLVFYQTALKMAEENNDFRNVSLLYHHIGECYEKLGNHKLAEEYTTIGLNGLLEFGLIENAMRASQSLYAIYKNQKKYLPALEMFELHEGLSDSLYSIENKEEIIQLKYQYDYEKQALLDSIDFAKKEELKDLEIKEQQAQLDKEETQRYALYGGIGLLLLLGLTLLRSYQQKKKDNVLIKSQHKALEDSHQEITDSIDYAKRLQDAILPPFEEMINHLPEHFVLFKPKDVVSGDFYWFEKIPDSDIKLFAVADCTGHGVPGAMVSLVCSSALNRAVKEFGLKEPAKILNLVRKIVIETFEKSGKGIRDGMDISLCALNGNKLTYVGAHNPIWLIRGKDQYADNDFSESQTFQQNGLTLVEFEANKQPVGLYENMVDFKQTEIELKVGDQFYLFTDGYADQFGGKSDKKFKKKALKRMLLDVNAVTMNEQKEIISTRFETWKGENEQVDDVCIIGVKFS